ncbi:response regulator [Paenarthrobacter ilicis]|uniref:Transcriptional regulatory protein n=1 Tax=Paenarthrobacter ilicis TaxID=43665 RepID=A0ABX0TN37_9MICC|nr:response regulator [Paenarthrobacter ilicis]MBM7792869.1 response regulator of citrate/malate metabolism [Paenarthrobacter ilicis]NIJ03245.1 response regulator of citrate/malate metabolism [Paenarthrobacter ilicis]
MTDIRVLVVEDEPIASDAHSVYISRLEGFVLAGTAPDGQSALRILGEFAASATPVDLVLLDMNLPDLHGLDVARRMRSAGVYADIIAITAVRELGIVRSAVSIGVVQYLIKPFTYATFADKLRSYRTFRDQLAGSLSGLSKAGASQSDVDQAFASLRAPTELPLPKGLSASTLESVKDLVRGRHEPVSASEVMDALGMSRVTARRYLEYLADAGTVTRAPRYGTPGRPENEYGWNRA